MSERMIEWNLAFTRDEVVAGLEKLLSQAGYVYTRTDTETETRLQTTLFQGALDMVVRPLAVHRSPFNLPITPHRALLTVTYSGVNAQEGEVWRHRLTLAFLRVGG
ncbi:MAG TPA: hypothetical protein VKK81_11010 [Candidatus Binatia bacterium]|nr:hypothetical protein [Candidatus Binatia bacterium]